MGREAKIPVTDRLKGECSGIFSRNISGGDTAPVCDGIYVSERPDRQERNLLPGFFMVRSAVYSSDK